MIYGNTYFLGIRHHGPGSANSVLRAFAEIQPDLILLEGPVEAEASLPLALQADMKPPVALLVYPPADLAYSALFPLVEFSPEWQVIRFALRQQIPLRLMDLPQVHQLALQKAANEALKQFTAQPEQPDQLPAPQEIHPYLQTGGYQEDPLNLLAQAADFDDGERWWEYMVEQRQEGLAVFSGIAEAMASVRSAVQGAAALPYREALREAWMRRTLRQAQADGYQRVAVVCGAWHVPALAVDLADPALSQEDAKLCQGLPKTSVTATWIPWSYERISQASGYGAGVQAPGWYQFLWESRTQSRQRPHYLAAAWLSQVARLLRDAGFAVASASVIEAVRLAETLTALRDKPMPDLTELNEATLAALCFGEAEKLALIKHKLIIGNSLGQVPADTPLTPLQADLARLQRSLRLAPEVETRALELDLRNSTDLERSQLLHQLNLLGIPWGEAAKNTTRSKGTFKESWRLQWQPEFTIRLIEAASWGSTVAAAATGLIQYQLQSATDLAQIIAWMDQALLADLPAVADQAVQRLEEVAAVASEAAQLMDALPALAQVLRYGNVRASDTALLGRVTASLVARIAVGLPTACYALDDDSAAQMLRRLERCHEASQLLPPAVAATWWGAVEKLVDLPDLHGYIAGKCCRLLLGAQRLTGEEVARRLHFALSVAGEPQQAAAWLEGLLRGSGLLLVHDEQLWQIVDQWLTHLKEEVFVQVLPLLRRTFTTFAAGERRMIGVKVKQGARSVSQPAGAEAAELDWASALATLPLLQKILGA